MINRKNIKEKITSSSPQNLSLSPLEGSIGVVKILDVENNEKVTAYITYEYSKPYEYFKLVLPTEKENHHLGSVQFYQVSTFNENTAYSERTNSITADCYNVNFDYPGYCKTTAVSSHCRWRYGPGPARRTGTR